MYQRKALLDHWPMSMIVYTGHSPRYMAIAVPNLMEWVPISCFAIPRCASLMALAASRRELITCRDVMWSMDPLDM